MDPAGNQIDTELLRQLLELVPAQLHGKFREIIDQQRQQEQQTADELDLAYELYHERDAEVLELRRQLNERDRQRDNRLEEQLQQLQQENLEQADRWAKLTTVLATSINAQNQATAAWATVQEVIAGTKMGELDEQHEQDDMAHNPPIELPENIEEPYDEPYEEPVECEPLQQPSQQTTYQRSVGRTDATDLAWKEGTVKLCIWYDQRKPRFPTPDEIEQLSQQTSLTTEQVQHWFEGAQAAEKDLNVDHLRLFQATYRKSHRPDPAERRRLANQTRLSYSRVNQ